MLAATSYKPTPKPPPPSEHIKTLVKTSGQGKQSKHDITRSGGQISTVHQWVSERNVPVPSPCVAAPRDLLQPRMQCNGPHALVRTARQAHACHQACAGMPHCIAVGALTHAADTATADARLPPRRRFFAAVCKSPPPCQRAPRVHGAASWSGPFRESAMRRGETPAPFSAWGRTPPTSPSCRRCRAPSTSRAP